MAPAENPRWTLPELEARVAAALGDEDAPSGRVNAVPDARVIRYYATIGLVDRPLLQGRTALYGRRHLLQLVAVKRLQRDGRSLAEVQAQLAGLGDAALARIARLRPALDAGRAAPAAAAPRSAAAAAGPARAPLSGRRAEAFWATRPAPTRPTNAPTALAVAQAIRLAPGATLLLEGSRPLGEKDLVAVERAAGALI